MGIGQPDTSEVFDLYGDESRNRTGVRGFAGRCITTLPSRQRGVNGHDCYCFWSLYDELAARGKGAQKWSGKRGSNSRPQPWQGCALPTELFPPVDMCQEPVHDL